MLLSTKKLKKNADCTLDVKLLRTAISSCTNVSSVMVVKTHHLSMSPLINWHGTGTASLQSGILTEWRCSWWRCAAAVNCGYTLVREGGRREERY